MKKVVKSLQTESLKPHSSDSLKCITHQGVVILKKTKYIHNYEKPNILSFIVAIL